MKHCIVFTTFYPPTDVAMLKKQISVDFHFPLLRWDLQSPVSVN